MVRFLRGHSLNWFVAYRLLLAGLIVVALSLNLL
jgi:undecaprenyl pyrophosphate phosphatase UppP